jgi:hypothetical protein
MTAERPGIYFSEDRPESVSLTLSPLSCAFPELAESEEERRKLDEETEARIGELVAAGRTEIHRRLEEAGKRLAGTEAVRRTRYTKRGVHPIRTLNPRFATRDAELLRRAIEEHREFEAEHESAKQRYIAGHTQTHFPSGTYGYRVVLGVRVAKRRRRAA